MLCRLTPPMCLNFLGLIHLDSHITKEDNIEETSYTKVKLTPYCEWIKIMNLKSVKSLDCVTSFPLFLIEHCKNREKKMILSMFKWKPLAFFSDHGTHGCDIIHFWWLQHLLPHHPGPAVYLYILQPGESHSTLPWGPAVYWGWWHDTGVSRRGTADCTAR